MLLILIGLEYIKRCHGIKKNGVRTRAPVLFIIQRHSRIVKVLRARASAHLILIGLFYIKRYCRIMKVAGVRAPVFPILIGLKYRKRYSTIIKVWGWNFFPTPLS